MEKNFRVIVDARALTKRKAGVARYIENLLFNIDEKIFDIILVSNNKIYTDLPFKKEEFLKFRFVPGSFFIAFILPFFLDYKRCIFWGTTHVIPLFKIYSILTIHDLVSIKFPEKLNLVNRVMNNLFFRRSVQNANRLLTVSNFTKNEIISYLKYEKKIEVVRNSVSEQLKAQEVTGDILDYSFIFSLCTIEPRKNLNSLIDSFNELKTKGVYTGKLVLGGVRGWEKSSFFKRILSHKDIIFLNFIQDCDLPYYYKECDLFVYPSIYEGFAIPPLEAHINGAKVICTKYSEIPNLNLNNTTTYDPFNENLTELIEIELRNNNKEVPNYCGSWSKEAKKLKKIFDESSDRL